MPFITEFYEQYKDKGIGLLTVCTKTGEDYGDCWSAVKEKNMETLVNTGDPENRSRIFSKYYTTSTPKIFILNKEKEIRIKKVPAENLGPVMEAIFKEDGYAESKG